MIWQITIIFLLATFSGICKAVMDTLSFHYERSIFKGSWWNPSESWRNKYDWAKGNKILGWLLANPLVILTDGWHFFQGMFSVSFAAAFAMSGIFLPWWSAFIVYFVSRGSFHVFFTWIFIKK